MLIIAIIYVQSLQAELAVRISNGVFWKTLPDVIVYDATIPSRYKMEINTNSIHTIPQYNKDHLCKSGLTHICTMDRHLSELGRQFDKELDSLSQAIHPKYWTNTSMFKDITQETQINEANRRRPKRGIDFIGEIFSFCCSVATQRQINALEYDQHELEVLLSRIDSGLRQNLREIASTSQNFESFQKQISDNILETRRKINNLIEFDSNLRNTIDRTVSETDFKIERAMFHIYTTLIRLINFERQVNEIELISACRDHKIPSSVVTPQILRQDLLELITELAKNNHELAISIDSISQYYKLQIADCTFSENYLYIQVRIPIIKQNRHWKLYELITTPFAWHNDTCFVAHDTLYLAVVDRNDNNQPSILRPISGTSLKHCNPYRDKLCFIPRFASDETQGHLCAHKMFLGGTVQELADHCSFHCRSATTLIISEIQDDLFMITHPKKELRVSCSHQSSVLDKTIYDHPGALQLYLPCNCSLYLNDNEIISPRFPCGSVNSETFKATHILPAIWTNLKTFFIHFSRSELTFGNFTECLNPNWTSVIPHLNLSSSSTISKIEQNLEDLLHKNYADLYAPHSDNIYLVWNVILSIVIFYLLLRGYPNPLAMANWARAEPTNQINSHEEIYICIIVFFALFTIVVVSITIIICIKVCMGIISNCRKRPEASIRFKSADTKEKVQEKTTSTDDEEITCHPTGSSSITVTVIPGRGTTLEKH